MPIPRLTVLALAGLILVLLANCAAWGAPVADATEPPLARGRVLNVIEQALDPTTGFGERMQVVTAEITDGEFREKRVTFENIITGNPGYDLVVRRGDRVILVLDVYDGRLLSAALADFERDRPIQWLLGAFLASLVLVGGVRGLRSLVMLGLTGAGVAWILLPAIIRGASPLGVAVGVVGAVTLLTMLIIAGPTVKAMAAGLGTVGGVAVAGALAALAGNAAHLVGMSSHEAQLLFFAPELAINFRGLLFAGMILGASGAIMDMGMSISSAVHEVRLAKPDAGGMYLFRAGMNVGRDVMGTMSNTLILAYTGSALPLFLLLMAYHTPAIKALNLDLVATEVIRALAGTIGIIFTIPLTAVAAAFLWARLPARTGKAGVRLP